MRKLRMEKKFVCRKKESDFVRRLHFNGNEMIKISG